MTGAAGASPAIRVRGSADIATGLQLAKVPEAFPSAQMRRVAGIEGRDISAQWARARGEGDHVPMRARGNHAAISD
ncbi:hypothetical protein CBR61_04630 [Porphyrobacter sp. CACIAM 03H1]|nr:hypothetical protein CBR61_04630 [Porphyrobacter sp. CACIAM 03H1]